MVTIIGGTFTMGQSGDDAPTDATPPIPDVTVGTFVMDAFEVTVARFRQFFNAGYDVWKRPIPYPNGTAVVLDSTELIEPEQTNDGSESYNWSRVVADREAHPINRVHWNVAMSFCAWDGARLATEAEWEYAARGRDVPPDLKSGRRWPFGDVEPTCAQAHFSSCEGSPGTIRVTAHRQSAGGLFGLAGNVHEWVADEFQAYDSACWPLTTPLVNPLCMPGLKGPNVIRGGAYSSTPVGLQGAARRSSDLRSAPTGMRCVRDAIKTRTTSP